MVDIKPSDFSAAPIKYPGKFEGEFGYTKYFWELVMNGEGEDFIPIEDQGCDTIFSSFIVDADEEEAFRPALYIGNIVTVWEDSQGFVHLECHKTREEATARIQEYLK